MNINKNREKNQKVESMQYHWIEYLTTEEKDIKPVIEEFLELDTQNIQTYGHNECSSKRQVHKTKCLR